MRAVPGADPKESYTRPEVRRMLGVTERQLKSWERHGLMPALDLFAIADLKVITTLKELREGKVAVSTIHRVVQAMRDRIADVENPLKELKLVAEGRHLRVRVGGQRMEAASGQLLLDFDSADLQTLVSFPNKVDSPAGRKAQRESAETWFQRGLELEHSGAPAQEAIAAYETAVKLDPTSAGAWLNLGTIYFNARMWTQAERFYRKALASDPNYPLAHFNLGNLYDERGEWMKALEHYKSAVKLNAAYADAHYNLALAYQNRGRVLEALRHWRTYLKLDPASQWAEIARRELDKLKKSTVVEGRRVETRGLTVES